AKLESGGLKFYGTLVVPTGETVVRVLVRNAVTGRSATRTARFTVSAMPGGAPALLPPFFVDAPGRWLMARAAARPDAGKAEYPFTIGPESFVPAAEPALENGGEARLALVLYNFGDPDKSPPLALRAEVLSADGRAFPASVTVAGRTSLDAGGARRLLLVFR